MNTNYPTYLALFNECLSKKYQHTENDGSYAIDYSEDGKQLNIWLQWSNGKVDWKNNFDFAVRPYKNMEVEWKVHRGFKRV